MILFHLRDCPCDKCTEYREWRSKQYDAVMKEHGEYPERGDITGAFANGIAYVMFGIIAVIALVFIVRWAITEYYITTHCTMVLGTRVCQ